MRWEVHRDLKLVSYSFHGWSKWEESKWLASSSKMSEKRLYSPAGGMKAEPKNVLDSTLLASLPLPSPFELLRG
jgi:hypothetical protein